MIYFLIHDMPDSFGVKVEKRRRKQVEAQRASAQLSDAQLLVEEQKRNSSGSIR